MLLLNVEQCESYQSQYSNMGEHKIIAVELAKKLYQNGKQPLMIEIKNPQDYKTLTIQSKLIKPHQSGVHMVMNANQMFVYASLQLMGQISH